MTRTSAATGQVSISPVALESHIDFQDPEAQGGPRLPSPRGLQRHRQERGASCCGLGRPQPIPSTGEITGVRQPTQWVARVLSALGITGLWAPLCEVCALWHDAVRMPGCSRHAVVPQKPLSLGGVRHLLRDKGHAYNLLFSSSEKKVARTLGNLGECCENSFCQSCKFPLNVKLCQNNV